MPQRLEDNADSLLMTRYNAASAGRQCAAAIIDALLIAMTAAAIYILTQNVVLTLIWTSQCVLLMAVFEGTRGITPMKALLGIRSVRAEGLTQVDAGVVPAGLKRITIKYCVLLGCTCILIIGLPIALVSPLFSRRAGFQGWAERIAGIVVVNTHDFSLVSVRRTNRAPAEGIDVSLSADSLDMRVMPEPHVVPAVVPSTPAPAPQASSPAKAQMPVPLASPRTDGNERRPIDTQRPRSATHQARPVVATPALPARPTAAPAQPARKPSQLLLFLENAQGIPLASKASIVLGRKPCKQSAGDTVIPIKDATGTVSRNHARLEIEDGRIWLTDLGSTNGTQVMCDGEEIQLAAHIRTEISSGSRISLGDISCSIAASGRGVRS